jgi:peptide-methionine (S)-S-oxide reductase
LQHDPTTINRQGNDVGTQYRSEIFYHNEQKKKRDYIGLMTAEDTFGKRIVTKISPVSKFYEAEKVHKNYYNDNNKAIALMLLLLK